MILVAYPCARPIGWLLAAFGVTLIYFWHSKFLIWRSRDPALSEAAAFLTLCFLPLSALASLVAWCSYLALLRRVRVCRGIGHSLGVLSAGAVALLVASGPGFLIFLGLVHGTASNHNHPT